MTAQRWNPDGATMLAVPGGRFVLASDYEAILDAQRGLTAKAEAETAEARKRAANAERYVAGEDLRSDFATAAEMRAALDALTRRLALAVAEVKAWRHRPTSFTNPQSTFTVADAEAVWGAIVRAKRATNSDPELAKMIGTGGVG